MIDYLCGKLTLAKATISKMNWHFRHPRRVTTHKQFGKDLISLIRLQIPFKGPVRRPLCTSKKTHSLDPGSIDLEHGMLELLRCGSRFSALVAIRRSTLLRHNANPRPSRSLFATPPEVREPLQVDEIHRHPCNRKTFPLPDRSPPKLPARGLYALLFVAQAARWASLRARLPPIARCDRPNHRRPRSFRNPCLPARW
jgi:hypothetical protein